jgi:Protein of unknown function (DUF1573)
LRLSYFLSRFKSKSISLPPINFNIPLTIITNWLTPPQEKVPDVCAIKKTKHMKKLIFLFMLALGAGVTSAQQTFASSNSKEAVPAFSWIEDVYDFGKLTKGKPVSHAFEFTNTGNVPLIIQNVKGSCGCTSPEWSKDPIPAGGKGYVKATFNAANEGVFSKTLTIISNVGENVVLTIKGNVEGKSASL